MQVVQGSNPAEDWKVIRDATAFSAVAFKMILKGTREGAHAFLHKNLHLHDASRYYSYFLIKLPEKKTVLFIGFYLPLLSLVDTKYRSTPPAG